MITLSEVTDNYGGLCKICNPHKHYNIPTDAQYVIEGFQRLRDFSNKSHIVTKVIISELENPRVFYYIPPENLELIRRKTFFGSGGDTDE